MTKIKTLKILLATSVFVAITQTVGAQNRVKENFDFDWQFHLGEDVNAMKVDFKPSGSPQAD